MSTDVDTALDRPGLAPFWFPGVPALRLPDRARQVGVRPPGRDANPATDEGPPVPSLVPADWADTPQGTPYPRDAVGTGFLVVWSAEGLGGLWGQ